MDGKLSRFLIGSRDHGLAMLGSCTFSIYKSKDARSRTIIAVLQKRQQAKFTIAIGHNVKQPFSPKIIS